MTRVAQIGNLNPTHSTENELRKALWRVGATVDSYQEGDPAAWERLGDEVARADFVLWTRTASELAKIPRATVDAVIAKAKAAGVPVVGYHLDIWWGLERERDIGSDPWFRLCDVLATADGGHDAQWEAAGIRHWWYPPAVSALECAPGLRRAEFESPVGFVGSWQGGYHHEWQHRHDLVKHLQARGDCRFWPEPGKPAVRGDALRDLYASVDVVVGDSCGGGPRYCSDRIPETLGRGGMLMHPRTEGVTDDSEWKHGPMFDAGHLLAWDHGGWDQLNVVLDFLLETPEMRRVMSANARAHVVEHHTYDHRMRALLSDVGEL